MADGVKPKDTGFDTSFKLNFLKVAVKMHLY